MTATIKTKDVSVDTLKGLAILAVIFGHIASPLSSFIYSWHMPLFFFISGFFIKTDESVKTFLLKNFKRIMIYFFVFAILGFLITYFRNTLLGRENESILQSLAGIFYWMDMDHLNNYGFVLWFLPALFWGKFVNYILLKYVKNKLIIGLLILLIFSIIISFKTRLPFALDIGLISSPWIYIGYIFYNYLKEPILKYWYYLLIAIPFLIRLPIPTLNLATRYFSSPVYNIVFSSLIAILLYILINKINIAIRAKTTLSFLGQNTVFLFIFHPYTNNIAYLITNRFFNDIWYIKFILSFGIIYLILVIIRRYFNKGILKHV
jgi:fucose 4-O-acetylase-like acetyltransferase